MRKSIFIFAISVLLSIILGVTAFAAVEISKKRAQEIALEKTGGGTVTECKLDFEDGRKVYEIDIINGNTKYEMDVCVTDSKIYNLKKKTISSNKTNTGTASEISSKQAQEIALAKTGGGTVVECKLDYDHGRKVYEIEIINGDTKHEMDVCVTDSKIYEYKKETVPNSGRIKHRDSTKVGSEITAEKAKEIAISTVGGGTVTKYKLDYDHGRRIYEIEVRYNGWEYEVDIDAATGKVLKYEIDD